MAAEIINQEIAGYFNKWGEAYSNAWVPVARQRLGRFETDLVRRAIELTLKNFGNERIRTLDVGIGTGRITKVFLDYNVEHYGIDVSSVMVDHCREEFGGSEKIKCLEVYDIVNTLPDDWGKFEVVSAMRILPYTPQWREALKNVYRALKPGGVLVFNFPNKYSSTALSKIIVGRKNRSYGSSYGELKQILTEIGFSKVEITGFARLLDVFYARCNGKVSADILLAIEDFLRKILGPTRLARLLYCVCRK